MGPYDIIGNNNMNELSEARLWKSLDTISERLTGIDNRLAEVVRLEERIKAHDQILDQHTSLIESHSRRIHKAEIWQASSGDKSSVEVLINAIQKEVSHIKTQVSSLETSRSTSKGSNEVIKDIAKWVAGIVAAYLVFKLTSGV